MKVTLPTYDVQKLITITKNIPDIDPNVPETIPGVKSLTVAVNLEEEMKKVLLFKSKNNSNNFGFEYDGHKYIINTVRNQNGKYIDINPQPYTGITFNDYYQKIDELEAKLNEQIEKSVEVRSSKDTRYEVLKKHIEKGRNFHTKSSYYSDLDANNCELHRR